MMEASHAMAGGILLRVKGMAKFTRAELIAIFGFVAIILTIILATIVTIYVQYRLYLQ